MTTNDRLYAFGKKLAAEALMQASSGAGLADRYMNINTAADQ